MIDEFFNTEKTAIDEELMRYFKFLGEEEKGALFGDFLSQFKNFVMNDKAKRIHPVLLIAAFSGIVNPMYLEEQIEAIRKASIAVELLHSGHIIHDDLIDDDDVRRGKPTFHIQLTEEISNIYKNRNETKTEELIETYGRDLSVLGGSIGYLLGLDVLKSSKFSDNLKLLAINEYSDGLNNLIKGQVIEEYMEHYNITMTMEQYLNIAELQRARMFEKSVKIGAILAKGNLHYQIKPLSEAMLKLGQVYAIRDDILDLKEDILGKKKKFIYICAVQNVDEVQSKRLNEIYGKDELTKDDVSEVELVFGETNALVIAEFFARNLVEQAKANLKEVYPDLNKKEKSFFTEFSDYIFKREF